MRWFRRILFWLVGVPLAIAVVAVGAFTGYVAWLSWHTPSIDSLRARPETSNSTVYAADGTRLGFIPAAQLSVRAVLQGFFKRAERQGE